jgi:PKD repeat protein
VTIPGNVEGAGVDRLAIGIIGVVVASGLIGAGLLGGCAGEPGTTPSGSGSEPEPAAGTPANSTAARAEELSEPLLVWAAASPESGDAPLSVRFTADLEGGTPPFAVSWTFGDTATSSERDTAHTYATPGTYRAELRVADAAGDTDSDWVEITVRAVTP